MAHLCNILQLLQHIYAIYCNFNGTSMQYTATFTEHLCNILQFYGTSMQYTTTFMAHLCNKLIFLWHIYAIYCNFYRTFMQYTAIFMAHLCNILQFLWHIYAIYCNFYGTSMQYTAIFMAFQVRVSTSPVGPGRCIRKACLIVIIA